MSEDKELISQILNGNQELYAELIRRYQAPVIALCRSMTGDHQEAEDLAQEIFVKAFYALGGFKGGSAFYTWLYRIALNHSRDFLRKKKRRSEESWENLVEKQGGQIEALLARPDTTKSFENQELISRALACLPEQSREILTLREVQGLTYEELAAVLKCSLDGVKGRLKRAREDLRNRLRHFLDLDTSNLTGEGHEPQRD